MKIIFGYFIASCLIKSNIKKEELVIEIIEKYAGKIAKDESLRNDEFVRFLGRINCYVESFREAVMMRCINQWIYTWICMGI